MRISKQLACISAVISACEGFQRHASKRTARNECLKQLNKKIMRKAFLASQKEGVQRLDKLQEVFSSNELGVAININVA